jgi:hypothetical protein
MSTIITRTLPLLTTLIVMSVLSCYSLYTDDNISAVAKDDNKSISKNGYSDKYKQSVLRITELKVLVPMLHRLLLPFLAYLALA